MGSFISSFITTIIIVIIFKFTIFSKKEEERPGYIVVSSLGFINLSKIWLILNSLLIIVFFIFGKFKELKVILLLLIGMFIFGVFCYLFYSNKRISFNDKVIEVEGFLKEKRIYTYEDILSAKNVLKDKVTVYTNLDKFTVDHELRNVDKFIKMLEDKGIKVETKNLFMKNID